MSKKIIAAMLSLLMLLGAAGCSGADTPPEASTEAVAQTPGEAATEAAPAADSEYPAYLNLESALPIVKEGETVSPRVAVVTAATAVDWKEMWATQYFKEYMNIEFQVEQIMDTARDERKNLMFASGDLPDIMINLALSPSEILRYGQNEQQLLSMGDYINETLTPDIVAALNDQPDAKAVATAPDGNIYTLPYLDNPNNPGAVPRLLVNMSWLADVGLESPRTIEELFTMARAFKEQDPGGVGAENVVPIGGSYDAFHPGFYILNALGYVIERDKFFESLPAIRNGEAEIPAGNPEVFKEYLTLMNTLYSEGLISESFFVMDQTAVTSQLKEGRYGLYANTVHAVLNSKELWEQWESVYPLTSELNPEPVWFAPQPTKIGSFVVSADTEYPELCMRFANAFYGEDCRFLFNGAADGTEEALGFLGNKMEGKSFEGYDTSRMPEGITSSHAYVISYLAWCQWDFGAWNLTKNLNYYIVNHLGGEDPGPVEQYDPNSDQYYRKYIDSNIMPYVKPSFPKAYYLDEETTNRLMDLKAVIDPYVREQVALFISGDRSLDTFDAYIEELKTIGFDEYEQIYKDIWANQ